jgi:hypothetical protein
MAWRRQSVRQMVALLALFILVSILITGAPLGVPGPLAFCLVVVVGFLVSPAALPQLFRRQSQQILSFPPEPCIAWLFERPPPSSLA